MPHQSVLNKNFEFWYCRIDSLNEADSKSIEHQRFFIRLIRIFIFLACALEIEEKDKKSYYKLRVNP